MEILLLLSDYSFFRSSPSQILSLRRKLNYLFKVLTGNVTGHYLLDLRNEQHRTVGNSNFVYFSVISFQNKYEDSI